MKLKRPLKILIVIVMLAAFYAVTMAWMNNFHVVIPNELYRSGQLSAGEIPYYTKRYGMRSILNLRGDNTGSKWYDREVEESSASGVQIINYRMSSKQVISREEALKLIEIMRAAPKPLLIHCNGGANRTSLATAIYLAGITGADERTAEAQLSFRFGNFPRWLGSSSRMSDNFEQLEDMFGYGGS